MTDCDLDSSVVDWVVDHPEVLPLLQSLRIDYCCGGKSLEYACREQHLDPGQVLAQLQQRVQAAARPDDRASE